MKKIITYTKIIKLILVLLITGVIFGVYMLWGVINHE